MLWVITDTEDNAIHGLPWLAQLIYLRVLRRFMDFETGIVGLERTISLQSIAETLAVDSNRGFAGIYPHKSAIRRSLGALERGGLIEKREYPRPGYLVFFLPLAYLDQSARKKADTPSTRSPTRFSAKADTEADTLEANEIAVSRSKADTEADTIFRESRHTLNAEADTHQVLGFREKTTEDMHKDAYPRVNASASTAERRPADPPPENLEEEEQGRVPYRQIVDAYHTLLPELPRVSKLTETRRRHIRARWHNEMGYLDEWEKYFKLVKRSRFLMGRTGGNGARGPFLANFDFLIRESTLVKVVEGYYRD